MIIVKHRALQLGSLFSLLIFPSSVGHSHPPWFSGELKAEVTNSLQLPATVKVAILHSRRPIAISCTGRYSYVDLKKGKAVTAAKQTILKIRNGKHGMTIGSKTYAAILIAPADTESHLTLNSRPYRGTLVLRRRGGIVDVIEQVGLEEYLYGVLPREVGADWPVESLKAQAVISRTYAVANIAKPNGKGYDVSNDVSSQVYGGLQAESPASNQAVDDTRGQILVDNKGVPVLTFFHSSCGGRTESPEYVWQEIQTAPNYLVSVSDSFCKDDPFYNWELNIRTATLENRLRRAGIKVGKIKKISIAKTSPSGRAWAIAVDSSRGRAQVQGNRFRLALGPEALRSTLLTNIEQKGKMFHFEGHGWGHGVGLCQWGARGRALAGQSYETILDAYYPNVRLVKAETVGEGADHAGAH